MQSLSIASHFIWGKKQNFFAAQPENQLRKDQGTIKTRAWRERMNNGVKGKLK